MIANITIQSLVTGDGTKYVITEADGFESPNVSVASTALAGRNGVLVHRVLWRERRIRIEWALKGSTISEYATLRTNLLKALDLPRAGNTVLYFTTTDGKTLQFTANLNSPIDGGFKPGFVTTGRIRAEFIVPDVGFYSQALNTTTITPPIAGGATLPTALPLAFASTGGNATILNSGNGSYFPVVRIYGPATNASLRNSTLNKQFSLGVEIEAGDYVEVDLASQTVLRNGIVNYLDYFDGDWWYLKTGTNTIIFSSDENDETSYAEIDWRESYIGI